MAVPPLDELATDMLENFANIESALVLEACCTYLIVVGKWNDRGADAKDHRRMDLAVSVSVEGALVLEVGNVHGYHGCLFFFDI